jgi:hypothetical protein
MYLMNGLVVLEESDCLPYLDDPIPSMEPQALLVYYREQAERLKREGLRGVANLYEKVISKLLKLTGGEDDIPKNSQIH